MSRVYFVTYRWYDTDTFCTNLCIADSEEAVRKCFADSEILAVRLVANDSEYQEAKRKGMPEIRA